ncbi:unnamed protein product [Chironomus riparius]|uniref:Uncharacterized protein n=1 Tax=Chironomus riparius TaxID=315576 RepID=A0A9N9RQ12_9DIPT|nr:unnamed protein product [Chironomus riparius]
MNSRIYFLIFIAFIASAVSASPAYSKLTINGNRLRQYSPIEHPFAYEKVNELTNCEEKKKEVENDVKYSSQKFSRSIGDPYYSQDMNCDDQNNCNHQENGNDQQQRRNEYSDSNASRKTSNIALKAAQEAKAAEEAQEMAGKEASKQAKFQLAEKAIQAAKAAQAALSAKKMILEELERELREAEIVVQDLSSSIQQSESNANAALRAYQQAQALLKMLSELIQVAQSTVGYAEQAAQGSQQELNEKTQLLEAAKNRVEKLIREMKAAKVDYTNTKKEAYKASMAAKEARQNASRVRRHQMSAAGSEQ